MRCGFRPAIVICVHGVASLQSKTIVRLLRSVTEGQRQLVFASLIDDAKAKALRPGRRSVRPLRQVPRVTL